MSSICPVSSLFSQRLLTSFCRCACVSVLTAASTVILCMQHCNLHLLYAHSFSSRSGRSMAKRGEILTGTRATTSYARLRTLSFVLTFACLTCYLFSLILLCSSPLYPSGLFDFHFLFFFFRHSSDFASFELSFAPLVDTSYHRWFALASQLLFNKASSWMSFTGVHSPEATS